MPPLRARQPHRLEVLRPMRGLERPGRSGTVACVSSHALLTRPRRTPSTCRWGGCWASPPSHWGSTWRTGSTSRGSTWHPRRRTPTTPSGTRWRSSSCPSTACSACTSTLPWLRSCPATKVSTPRCRLSSPCCCGFCPASCNSSRFRSRDPATLLSLTLFALGLLAAFLVWAQMPLNAYWERVRGGRLSAPPLAVFEVILLALGVFSWLSLLLQG